MSGSSPRKAVPKDSNGRVPGGRQQAMKPGMRVRSIAAAYKEGNASQENIQSQTVVSLLAAAQKDRAESAPCNLSA